VFAHKTACFSLWPMIPPQILKPNREEKNIITLGYILFSSLFESSDFFTFFNAQKTENCINIYSYILKDPCLDKFQIIFAFRFCGGLFWAFSDADAIGTERHRRRRCRRRSDVKKTEKEKATAEDATATDAAAVPLIMYVGKPHRHRCRSTGKVIKLLNNAANG